MRHLFIIGALFLALSITGQSTFQPKQVNLDLKGVIYRKEWAVDLRLHTNGFSIGYNSGRIKSYDETNYIQFEIGYMRDRRERSQNKNLAFPGLGQSSSFAFGKINNMFVARGGWGHRKYLSEKAKRKGLAIGYTYLLGPSIAILKPYYLQLLYREEENGTIATEIRNERFIPENRDKFLNYDDVYGGGGFFKGFDEINITPGVHGKAAMVFSLGAYDKYVKTVESGIMVDIYPKKIAIMAETQNITNRPYFINFYVNLHLGRRSN